MHDCRKVKCNDVTMCVYDVKQDGKIGIDNGKIRIKRIIFSSFPLLLIRIQTIQSYSRDRAVSSFYSASMQKSDAGEKLRQSQCPHSVDRVVRSILSRPHHFTATACFIVIIVVMPNAQCAKIHLNRVFRSHSRMLSGIAQQTTSSTYASASLT